MSNRNATRVLGLVLAAACGAGAFSAHAVPVTYSTWSSGTHSIWTDSMSMERHGDFSLQANDTAIYGLPKFDSSLGSLLSVELKLTSHMSHPTQWHYFPNSAPAQNHNIRFGAYAYDPWSEPSSYLSAYYDARVGYRTDFRMTVDPLNTNLFTAGFANAAFGSCENVQDLFLDIGNNRPSCFASNRGSSSGALNYNWGTLTGDLSQFVGPGDLMFRTKLAGDAYGHCDNDDYGDQCWVQFATRWNFRFDLNYVYEPYEPGGGADSGGNTGGGSVPVAEPAGVGLMGFACLAFAAIRRLRQQLVA